MGLVFEPLEVALNPLLIDELLGVPNFVGVFNDEELLTCYDYVLVNEEG